MGSERRGWRRGDGTGRPRDREGTKKLKNSINISRRIVIGKRKRVSTPARTALYCTVQSSTVRF